MTDTFHLAEPNFQSQHSGKCDLHIHISKTTVNYAIIDIGKDQLIALASSAQQANGTQAQVINSFLDEHRLGSLHFRKVKISVETDKFTFIPDELYTDEDRSHYETFIGPGQETDVVQTSIGKLKLKTIIAVDDALQQVLKTHFRQPQLYSQADPFITGARSLYAGRRDVALYLNITPPSFEAVVFKDGKLLFYNLFDCNTADEFNYFILLMLQQLDIEPGNCPLTLCGRVSQGDEYYSRLAKYFEQIHYADPSKLLSMGEVFGRIEPHHYFSLFALSLCG